MDKGKNPTISVIVPVYNVEKYLRQCIDSILAQTFQDFELILVDDGSTDMCGTICDEYAKKDSRIRVIHQKNGGLSAARNAGIAWMKGNSRSQYVTFIDSDDWVIPDYLLFHYIAIQKNDADISISGFCPFEDGEVVELESNGELTCDNMNGRDVCIQYYQMDRTIPIAACAKLYKTSLFENIQFPEGKVYEDQGTVPRLWYAAEKIVIFRKRAFYAYRVLANSLSHGSFSSRKFDDVWNVQLCERFFSDKEDTELAALCSRFREILQAKYIVLAHHHDAADQIPDEYQMSLGKALRILRLEIRDDIYTWYLSLVYPGWEKPHSYIRKIEEILGIAKTDR